MLNQKRKDEIVKIVETLYAYPVDHEFEEDGVIFDNEFGVRYFDGFQIVCFDESNTVDCYDTWEETLDALVEGLAHSDGYAWSDEQKAFAKSYSL